MSHDQCPLDDLPAFLFPTPAYSSVVQESTKKPAEEATRSPGKSASPNYGTPPHTPRVRGRPSHQALDLSHRLQEAVFSYQNLSMELQQTRMRWEQQKHEDGIKLRHMTEAYVQTHMLLTQKEEENLVLKAEMEDLKNILESSKKGRINYYHYVNTKGLKSVIHNLGEVNRDLACQVKLLRADQLIMEQTSHSMDSEMGM